MHRWSLKQREQRYGYLKAMNKDRCEQCDCDPCECEDWILTSGNQKDSQEKTDNWPKLRYMEAETQEKKKQMAAKKVVECNCTCNSEEMRDAIDGLTAALRENTDVYIGMLEAIRASEGLDPMPEEVDDDDKVAAV